MSDTNTPDYGETWHVDSANGVMDQQGGIICYPFGTKHVERAFAERIKDCVNACAGMADPASEIAELKRELAEAREQAEQMREAIRQTIGYSKSTGGDPDAVRLLVQYAEEADE